VGAGWANANSCFTLVDGRFPGESRRLRNRKAPSCFLFRYVRTLCNQRLHNRSAARPSGQLATFPSSIPPSSALVSPPAARYRGPLVAFLLDSGKLLSRNRSKQFSSLASGIGTPELRLDSDQVRRTWYPSRPLCSFQARISPLLMSTNMARAIEHTGASSRGLKLLLKATLPEIGEVALNPSVQPQLLF